MLSQWLWRRQRSAGGGGGPATGDTAVATAPPADATTWVPTTTTTTTYQERTTTTTEPKPTNHSSNNSILRARIYQRVQERNHWLVHGALPTVPTGSTHWEALREIIRYQPPSQHELDRVFPLVSPMDWSQLVVRSCGRSSSTSTTTATNTVTDGSNDDESCCDASTAPPPPPPPPPPSNIQLTWLGHSSLLVQMGGSSTTASGGAGADGTYNILTDPVFSQRASPVQWAGPKRYRSPPCSLSQLLDHVPIDAVLISHNHYDHLDYATVRELAQRNRSTQFIVPLGLAQWFHSYVLVPEDPSDNHSNHYQNDDTPNRIVELDWHESVQLNGLKKRNNNNNNNNSNGTVVTVTGLPARHWSNRIGDVDQSLWCGYSVVATTALSSTQHNNKFSATTTTAQQQQRPSFSSFYFAGDTAWWDNVTEDIGRRYGPFDVAALPIGAYHPWEYMKANHVNVDEAVQLKDAVRAHYAVPIHWGTFPLTVEPVMEPREKLAQLMAERPDRDSFTTWRIGETKRFVPTMTGTTATSPPTDTTTTNTTTNTP